MKTESQLPFERIEWKGGIWECGFWLSSTSNQTRRCSGVSIFILSPTKSQLSWGTLARARAPSPSCFWGYTTPCQESSGWNQGDDSIASLWAHRDRQPSTGTIQQLSEGKHRQRRRNIRSREVGQVLRLHHSFPEWVRHDSRVSWLAAVRRAKAADRNSPSYIRNPKILIHVSIGPLQRGTGVGPSSSPIGWAPFEMRM